MIPAHSKARPLLLCQRQSLSVYRSGWAGRQSAGEAIDAAAEGCGPVSCAGYAILSAAWKLAGAEPLSQLVDKGWSGTSTSDKFGAALAMAAVLPVGRVMERASEGLGVVYRRINPETLEEYIGQAKSE